MRVGNLWKAFKFLPWQAKVALVFLELVPLVMIWAGYNSNLGEAAEIVKNNGFVLLTTVTPTNLGLLAILGRSIEQHPSFFKDFWTTVERIDA